MSYIKLDRKIKDWQWSKDPLMVALWVRLLLEANYQDSNWKGMIIPRGTVVTSVKSLSEKTGLSVQQTRNKLKHMKSTNEISIKSTNKYSLITINKWEEYQGADENPTNKPTNKRILNQQTKVTKSNNTKRSKEDKNTRNIYIGKSDDFIRTFEDFTEMRIKKKKPMTDRAKELILKDLEKLSPNERTQIAILEKSIKEGWSGVYALKGEQELHVYDTKDNIRLSNEEEEELLKLMKGTSNVS